MSSPVLLGGKLYGLSHLKAGHLFCLDADTGQLLWEGDGRFAKNAAILVVDNLLAVLTSDGRLIFAKPGPAGLQPVADYQVDSEGRSWACPALSGNLILVKGGSTLVCWSLSP